MDEPDGEVDDPTFKSKIAIAYAAAKFLKACDPDYVTMTDPLPQFLMSKAAPAALARLRECYDILQLYRPALTGRLRERVGSFGFRELWTYSILGSESTSPKYRRDLWENMRDGYREISPFWHMDEAAGGDMFDPHDSNRPGRYEDYASLYADFDRGTALLSRRQLAYDQGCEDARLILCLRERFRADATDLARVDAIVREAADVGTMAAMDAAREELLHLAEAVRPAARRELFNGRDLSGWYTYLQGRGRNSDPKGVVCVTNGVIRISGDEWGALVTAEAFRDYRLTVEYRWLGTRFGPKKEKALDSGILFHSVGRDGGFAGIWMFAHEYNLIAGATGDIWTVGPGHGEIAYRLESEADPVRRIEGRRIWKAGGERAVLTGNDRLCRMDIADGWTDTPGVALSADERPVGEWNTAVLECAGDEVRCLFNGRLVNSARRLVPSAGKIQLQSEGCGVEFRRVTIEPLATGCRP